MGSPYTKEDEAQTRELIDDTLRVFKTIVQTARSTADIDQLLTARVWYGQEALDRNIVDELIITGDDYMSQLNKNHDVFIFEIAHKNGGMLESLLGSALESTRGSLMKYLHSLGSRARNNFLGQHKSIDLVEL